MNEAKLTANIVSALNKINHVWAFKIHGGPHQRAGLPDVVGVRAGTFFGLEVKLPGKEKNLTEIQAATLRRIRKAGGISAMVTSVDQAKEVVIHGGFRKTHGTSA